MILPATAQILLHSSVLIWTAYYLIVKPSVVLNSTIVDIFGQALQLVNNNHPKIAVNASLVSPRLVSATMV